MAINTIGTVGRQMMPSFKPRGAVDQFSFGDPTTGQGINEGGANMMPVGQPGQGPMIGQPGQPANPLGGYTGSGINVGQASIGVNPQNIADSPAYKFRMEQGMQAINRSGAAKGNLVTGGTLKDALGYGQGLASTEYDKDFQRQFGLAGLNADIGQGNAGRNLSGLLGLYGGGMNAASGMAGAYGNAGAAGAAGTYGAASAINQGVSQVGNTIGEYLARRTTGGGLPPNLPGMQVPGGGLQPGGSYPNILTPPPQPVAR